MVQGVAESPGELESGQLFAGQYHIERCLGEGSRRWTYLAEDVKVGDRLVAISVVKPHVAALDPDGTKREANLLSRVGNHTHIVAFNYYGADGPVQFLVFEYLSGGTLAERIERAAAAGEHVPADMVVRHGRQLANALTQIHTAGVIHRDVAPHNIWLSDRQKAKLGNFDSAVLLDGAGGPRPIVTEGYASPEECHGGPVDQRSDLYSLGRVLISLALGELAHGDPAVVRECRPDLPPAFHDLLASLVASSPGDRPSTAEEVADRLNEIRHGLDAHPVIAKGEGGQVELKPGSVFAGRYKIMRLLGEGDRKRTYLAQDTVVPRRVAVALIKSAAGGTDPAGTRREAEALAPASTHDNVVTLHDWGIVGGVEYLVFDFLSGGTLREYLAKRAERGKPLSADDVMRMGRQLARALAHVHKLGLIHRDLGPANIWLDERQVAHLGDFDSAVSRDEALGPAGLPPTTEGYVAPEQLAGLPFDERSDLYSLGAVLFEALVGERPAREPGAAAARLSRARPDLPRGLNQVIRRMLAESLDERPASAEEVLEALKAVRTYRSAEEDLVPWSETLPFPLASLLWHYEGEPEPAAKLDSLLKFFEALAQFTAAVLLSACLTDGQLLEENRAAWFGGSMQQSLKLERATFGTWIELRERLARTIRSMLERKDGTARCCALFAATDTDLVEALVAPALSGILHQALDCRNNWIGHGGIASEHLHKERLGDLHKLLGRTHSVLGWSFEAWTLLKPGPMTRSQGRFDLTATILKGPNPAFRRKHIQVPEALDASRLYLLGDVSGRTLELVPFIQVHTVASAQDACYFYSRMGEQSVRWVSYHFHAAPELDLPDDGVLELLAKLQPVNSATGTAQQRARD